MYSNGGVENAYTARMCQAFLFLMKPSDPASRQANPMLRGSNPMLRGSNPMLRGSNPMPRGPSHPLR